ncbi:MAG: orotidine-5'-phosphate decarboxylase [bacterium]|nr:orotidine-5'-phosphate decarboxylase [bacterium]
MKPYERILVALDTPDIEVATELAKKLEGKVGGYKIGLEFITAMLMQLIAEPRDIDALSKLDQFRRLFKLIGPRLFWDGKFHDIPNTVAGAVAAAAELGVWMLNVHCLGGQEMMYAAIRAADQAFARNSRRALLIGVTVLTSHDLNSLEQVGIKADSVEEAALKLAVLAANSGLDGVVCSPKETAVIRKAVCDDGFVIINPGIRPLYATKKDDQARVTTPAQAIEAGADYLVIGRPITEASEYGMTPREAVVRIVDEIAQVG